MARVRLLLDADVPILLAQVLRQRGHDVVHARECGLVKSKDPSVMASAVTMDRTLMTHDVVDYAPLVAQYGVRGLSHPGVVFAEQLEFRDLLARSLEFLSERTAEDMVDGVVWLGAH